MYSSQQQKEIAEAYIQGLNKEKIYDSPVVTEIKELTTFYEAEKKHQDYYSLNKNQSYCMYVIRPKLDKFQKEFKDKLRKDNTIAK